MSKKKLNIKTKQNPFAENPTKEPIGLIKKPKTYPRSYRWRKYDIELIEDLISKTKDLSSLKVDVTKLLRGALYIASKKKPEQLLNAIIEAEQKSIISKIN